MMRALHPLAFEVVDACSPRVTPSLILLVARYFKGAILDRNRLLSGFRMTQRRSKINDCLLQQRFNAFFPFCYPNTYGEGRDGAQDTSTFGPYFNTQKYKYTSFSYPGGDSDSGFVVNFNADAATALKQVAELKADRWIDQSTRWVRVDMAMYNPSANLFSHVEFSVEFDNTGKLWPRTRVTTMKTEAYLNTTRDYIQIVLEIVLMIGASAMHDSSRHTPIWLWDHPIRIYPPRGNTDTANSTSSDFNLPRGNHDL